jgi:hypothetical protein
MVVVFMDCYACLKRQICQRYDEEPERDDKKHRNTRVRAGLARKHL